MSVFASGPKPLIPLRPMSRSRVPGFICSLPARPFHPSFRNHNAFKSALESNQRWAEDTGKQDPSFFPTSAKGQAPSILWIGCSDSRVPETTLLGLKPGDVFTHRNIANIVNPTDVSLLSVVQYAVAHIKVKHIVLCGHTNCGGVNATLGNGRLDVLDVWLQPMRALREKHANELAKLEGAEKLTCLAEYNVKAGVDVLRRIPTVIDAIRTEGLQLHGVIYELASGTLEELDTEEQEDDAAKREAAFSRG